MNASEINSILVSVIDRTTKSPADTLTKWLSQLLSDHAYRQLPETLGVSDKKLTRLLSGVDPWGRKEFVSLYVFLVTKYEGIPHPSDFITQFKIKNEILHDEMLELHTWYENFYDLKENYFKIDRNEKTPQEFLEELESFEGKNIAWTGFKYWVIHRSKAA